MGAQRCSLVSLVMDLGNKILFDLLSRAKSGEHSASLEQFCLTKDGCDVLERGEETYRVPTNLRRVLNAQRGQRLSKHQMRAKV